MAVGVDPWIHSLITITQTHGLHRHVCFTVGSIDYQHVGCEVVTRGTPNNLQNIEIILNEYTTKCTTNVMVFSFFQTLENRNECHCDSDNKENKKYILQVPLI